MKKIATLFASIIAIVALAACEVPEDEGPKRSTDTASKVERGDKGDKKVKKAKKDSGPVETKSQESARRSAESYVEMSGFSRKGLIDQLKFEGFSHKDAVYGADNCGAKWKDEAAESAESYLEMSGFSRSGLIDQLEFEGFTREQAEYGATQAGL